MSVVRLGSPGGDRDAADWSAELESVAAHAAAARTRVADALHFARSIGTAAPQPGAGDTLKLWELLATVGSIDLTVARAIEPHLDAVAIVQASGEQLPEGWDGAWGVFAAEGPGVKVQATAVRAHDGAERWTLSGTKPWCSLARQLDHALITAHTTPGNRRLFAIDLRDERVTVQSGGWAARGLAEVESGPIKLDDVAAIPVGTDRWYLERPGFSWGGIGVAAIWFGASVALGRRLRTALQSHEPDQIGLMVLGEVDIELHQARAVLTGASVEVDASSAGSEVETSGGSTHPAIVAQRVRSTIARSAERVSQLVGHALGPAPLALEQEHAKRVADLALYIRQDHAERDLARLGTAILELEDTPW